MNNMTRGRLRTPRFQALLAAGVLVAGMGLAATADATPILHASVGGAPGGVDHYETFDALPLGSAGGTLPSGITVSFAPDAGVVKGSLSGLYAAPFLSGNNGVNFGSQPDGVDTTNFITSGSESGPSPHAAAILTFPGEEIYMGLLWGSVDAYNTLTFYNGTTFVAAFTGGDVTALASGNQGEQGTFYVNINFTTPFTSVVATSSQYAFEFDNVAFRAYTIGVPEPRGGRLFLLGLLLLGPGYWLNRRDHRLG